MIAAGAIEEVAANIALHVDPSRPVGKIGMRANRSARRNRKSMMSQPHIGIRSRLGLLFRALRHRNYRLFFLSQSISQAGTWMQQVAVLWLAYRLSNDVVVVGLLGFVAQVPTFLLAPLAGIWADRLDRRRILLVTQTLAMLQALSLAGLALSDHLTLAPLLVLAAVLGSIYAFDMTASQAMVKELVKERDDLSSAIALNAIILHSARLMGPVLAGGLIVFWGEAACFLVNGISFLPVLAALAAIRLEQTPAAMPSTHLHGSFADGLSYACGCRPIRLLLFLVAWLSLLGMPYTLLPAFVRETLAAEGDALGWLMGAAGLGALAASWHVGSRPTALGTESELATVGVGLALALFGFALTRTVWLAIFWRFWIGYAVLLQLATANALMQTVVNDSMRGRVMSFYTMALIGGLPLGNLVGGLLASQLGVPSAFAAMSAAYLAGVLWFGQRLRVFRLQSNFEPEPPKTSESPPLVPLNHSLP